MLRWGTVYAHQNLTAQKFFSDWTDGLDHSNFQLGVGLDHTSSVPAVSWWKVGKVAKHLQHQKSIAPKMDLKTQVHAEEYFKV